MHVQTLLYNTHDQQVIWKNLFKASSSDHDTFSHLCSLLGRLPKAKDPKKDMNACTDALLTVLKGHYVACACSVLGIVSPNDTPKHLPPLKTKEQKSKFVAELSRQVVNKCSIIGDALLQKPVEQTKDAAYNYAMVFCHFASLALEFRDAWSEGDGERVLRCWKVFLLHFRSSGRTKYAWEALRMQFQLVTLSPSLSHQLKWGRFINTHGGLGRNIPCDLFNEHMNKLFKEILNNMGSNMTTTSINRAARSVTALCHIRDKFDSESNVPVPTSLHSTKSDAEDVAKVVSILMKNKTLTIISGRKLSQFKNFSANPLTNLKWNDMKTWILRKRKQMLSLTCVVGEGNLSDSEGTDCSDIDTDTDN